MDKEREPVAHLWECLGRWSAYLVDNGTQADCAPPQWLVDAIKNATAPPQRKPLTDAHLYLARLVEALDGAFISTWQSTAAWQAQLNEARDYLAAHGIKE